MKETIEGFHGVILLLVVVPMTIYMFVVVPIGLIAVFFDKEEKFKNLLDRYMMVFAGPVLLAKILFVLPLWLALSPIFWIAGRLSTKTPYTPSPERSSTQPLNPQSVTFLHRRHNSITEHDQTERGGGNGVQIVVEGQTRDHRKDTDAIAKNIKTLTALTGRSSKPRNNAVDSIKN